MDQPDVQGIVQQAIEEYMKQDSARREPAYKTELLEERRRREQLEKRLNEMSEENARTRAAADEAQRATAIRAELQRLGVVKVDLAYRAVQDGIARSEDGRMMAGDQPMGEYLAGFVEENPELLPARISGGSGVHTTTRNAIPSAHSGGSVDIDKIRPGMSKEEMDRVRQEIARLAGQALKGM